MRALFVGGTVDNSELDFEPGELPKHYPHGDARAQYRLHEIGSHQGEPAYAVYAAVEMSEQRVKRIVDERGYPRRFQIDQRLTLH